MKEGFAEERHTQKIETVVHAKADGLNSVGLFMLMWQSFGWAAVKLGFFI